MVQADVARNYYADLGVPATADENDVRKAFRQLALRYHPDRNPGREAEFVTKFQQIQAAHEILSDPTQRAKYDQDRRKFRGLNIPQPGPNTPRARPPPPNRQTHTTTGSDPYYRAPPPRPTPQRPPPPQQYPTYTNGADRFTSRNFRAPPTAQQQRPRQSDAEARANFSTAWQKMKQPRGEEQPQPQPQPPPRPQNPNVNNPNGTPFGRSKSTRTPHKKGFDPMTPGVDEGQARSAYRSHFERPVPSPPLPADPLKQFKEQFKEQMRGDTAPNVPYAEGNRVRTPYASAAAGERTSMFAETLGRSSSVRNSPTHGHRAAPSQDAGAFSDSGRTGQWKSYSGRASNPIPLYSSSSDDESEAEVFHASQPGKKGPSPSNSPPPKQQSEGQGLFGTPLNGGPTESRPKATPVFKSRSSEGINMKFSPSDWHGKFEGNPDFFTPSMPPPAVPKGRTSPTRGRPPQRTAPERNPFARQSQPPPPPPPFPQTQPNQIPPAPAFPPPPLNTQFGSQSAKFKPEQWAETFKKPTWVFEGQIPKETSPRRASTATTRSKTAAARKASTIPTTNGVAAEKKAEDTKRKYQASAEDASNGDGDAMDIDSATPPVEKPQPPSTDTDRTFKPGTPIIFGSPQTAQASPQAQTAPAASKLPNGSATAPPLTTKAKPSSGLNGLEGLTNVEPFLPTTDGGLSGLGDLADTLPFKSKASSSHPTKPNTAQKLKYPPIPVAPAPPTTLDEPSTRQYLRNMNTYIKLYREYSKTMTTHHASREAELESLDDDFCLLRGETSKKIGFAGYINRVKEDQAALEAWKLGMEMHSKALRQCEEVRNKTMRVFAFAEA